MLTSRNMPIHDETDFVHNYYERQVLQEAFSQSARIQEGDRDFLADVACVALNRLPPRYIRHDVDMTFFMSPQDMLEIETKVSATVKAALAYVEAREKGEDPKLPPLEVALFATRADKPAKAAATKQPDNKSADNKPVENKAAHKNTKAKPAARKKSG